MADTLREYLVELGFKVDENGWKGFNAKVQQSARNVINLGATSVAVAAEIGVAVERVARHYEELYYVSQRSGSAVRTLKAYEFGARQIGLTADAARSSVEGFSAAIRMNPGVRAMFQNMGIDTGDSKKAIGQMADTMKSRFGEAGYFVAARYASMAGMDEGTFRQIWSNREKLREQEEQSLQRQKEAGFNAEKFAKDSVKFGDDLRKVYDRWGLLIDRVSSDWLPLAQKTVNGLDFVVQKMTAINNLTNGWAGMGATLAAAFITAKVAIMPVVSLILRLLGLGGVAAAAGAKSLGIGAGALRMFGPAGAFALGLGLGGEAKASTIPGGAGMAHPSDLKRGAGGKQTDAVAFYERLGWTREQASGIAANLQAESGMRHDAVGDGGKAYGAGQWHPNRQADFKQWSGKDIRQSTLEEQLAFVHYEMTQGKEKLAGNALRGTRTARDAGAVVSRMYERPADVLGAASNRGAAAEALFGSQSGGNASINQKTEINISGVSDPKKVAGLVNENQQRVNGDIVRNTKSMFQ